MTTEPTVFNCMARILYSIRPYWTCNIQITVLNKFVPLIWKFLKNSNRWKREIFLYVCLCLISVDVLREWMMLLFVLFLLFSQRICSYGSNAWLIILFIYSLKRRRGELDEMFELFHQKTTESRIPKRKKSIQHYNELNGKNITIRPTWVQYGTRGSTNLNRVKFRFIYRSVEKSGQNWIFARRIIENDCLWIKDERLSRNWRVSQAQLKKDENKTM